MAAAGGADGGGGAARNLGIEGLEVLGELGRGGFGVVYRARQVEFNRVVAVKVLSQSASDADAQRRFERERAALGTASNHPNIVSVYEAGVSAYDRPYLIMEYLAGGSLADRLRGEGPLSWQDAVAVGAQLSGALESAHRHGVLHRDVKPENVLVSAVGDVQLADFGIARMADATRTQTGQLSASLAHAAPEVLNGARPTAASDVYSLASTVMALILGHAPFAEGPLDTPQALITRALTSNPPSLTDRGVPAEVQAVLHGAMAKDLSRRPDSALAFGEELAEVAELVGVACPAPRVISPEASVSELTPSPDLDGTGGGRVQGATRIRSSARPMSGGWSLGRRGRPPSTTVGAGSAQPGRWRRRVGASAVLVVVAGAAAFAAVQAGRDGPEVSVDDTLAAAGDPTGAAVEPGTFRPEPSATETLPDQAAPTADVATTAPAIDNGSNDNQAPGPESDPSAPVAGPSSTPTGGTEPAPQFTGGAQDPNPDSNPSGTSTKQYTTVPTTTTTNCNEQGAEFGTWQIPDRPILLVSDSDNWLSTGTGFVEHRATVTFEVFDSPGGQRIFGPASAAAKPDGSAEVYTDDSRFEITPGMYATVTADGTGSSRGVLVEGFRLANVDTAGEIVNGSAPVGATVTVLVADGSTVTALDVVADANRQWRADFTGRRNITSSQHVTAYLYAEDGDGNATSYRDADVIASLDGDFVAAERGFTPGGTATLTVHEGPGGPVVARTTVAIADGAHATWNVPIEAGMYVTATDNATGLYKELVVEDVTIDVVDRDGDRIMGTAPTGRSLLLDVGLATCLRATITDEDWLADFGAHDIDIPYGSDVGVRASDADGDATVLAWSE